MNSFAAIGDERKRFQLLTLESRDPVVANAIATTGILHWAPQAVLAELCQQHGSLEPEARRDLLKSLGSGRKQATKGLLRRVRRGFAVV